MVGQTREDLSRSRIGWHIGHKVQLSGCRQRCRQSGQIVDGTVPRMFVAAALAVEVVVFLLGAELMPVLPEQWVLPQLTKRLEEVVSESVS